MNNETSASETSGVRIERMVLSPASTFSEEAASFPAPSVSFRPRSFDEYPGQDQVKTNLRVYVEAAKNRTSPLDHVILHGPPGLGKTTLAHILAFELNKPFFTASGPALSRPGDLAGLLTGLPSRAVLFVDEIHRIPIQVEELLYSAMEDFSVDVMVGQGQTARSIKLPLEAFTLVGATTKLSQLSRPFLSRFGIQERLDYYDIPSLQHILHQASEHLQMHLSPCGSETLAQRSRGTPRVAHRLLRRTRDFAHTLGKTIVDRQVVLFALEHLDIDSNGLDRIDRDILRTIWERHKGGPVGIEAIAVALGEESATLEEVYEPYLVHRGFIARSPRGRLLTELGRQVVGF